MDGGKEERRRKPGRSRGEAGEAEHPQDDEAAEELKTLIVISSGGGAEV